MDRIRQVLEKGGAVLPTETVLRSAKALDEKLSICLPTQASVLETNTSILMLLL